jgi:hypothetical protein
MTWSYTGDPSSSAKDEVRFLSGCTNTDRQLVSDEEINYALSQYSEPNLAAALVLRALAALFSRETDYREGDISVADSKQAKAFLDMANELDPSGITTNAAVLALPSFGGLSKTDKETLASDTDAVQPSFYRGMNDYPGGPGDNVIDVPNYYGDD